ncbi:hypothetical protein L596_029938 [Steinernema carpocapsae]|uniref:Uncharacterized protein n=1 Tax=Steinernema carpocapsae TaxID=34508 RepID=A0A4U5LR85_STECR|nr:hypothetical protein L596_029938 [Steinernema carpocapsae]
MKLFVLLILAFCFLSTLAQKCDKNVPCSKGQICGAGGKCVDVMLMFQETVTPFKKECCSSCIDRCVNDACPKSYACTKDDWCCKDCKQC